ncbi:MAG TPA: hypothetical protein VFI65_20650 [Streptosporangiaceae bacterium]|nr:hypothetical protein [Streptosporangiaceae bacterium]
MQCPVACPDRRRLIPGARFPQGPCPPLLVRPAPLPPARGVGAGCDSDAVWLDGEDHVASVVWAGGGSDLLLMMQR